MLHWCVFFDCHNFDSSPSCCVLIVYPSSATDNPFPHASISFQQQCLLSIILKAAEQTIQRRDRTMALPHIIAPLNHANTNGGTASAASGSNGGELGIGGLSVSYGIADPIEWTRAMKFVLTDVKWLVAYSAKHVDR